MKKFGFVSVVGRPNAGKSTIINALLDEELNVVTSMPQTTRSNLRGILTAPQGQIVFVDTPGMHQGKYKINEAMADSVRKSLKADEADAVLYIVDLSRSAGEEESLIAQMVSDQNSPVYILFNKSDLVENPGELCEQFFVKYPFLKDKSQRVISAASLQEKTEILEFLFSVLPEGEPHFPEEHYTDANLRFLAAEIIQKQIIINTKSEVPHASLVLIEQWDDNNDYADVKASIIVETTGQKAIMIGDGGKRIKQIRQFSRKEIAKIADLKINLELFVKVRKKWRENPGILKSAGLI